MSRALPPLRPLALLIATALATQFAHAADTELETVTIQTSRPTLYKVPDVNVGALGAKDPLDVPLSIQSYPAELIANQAAHTLTDVTKNDASVQNASVGGAFDNVNIRGFGVDWANTLRRDGLSLSPYMDVPLENIERIDVLKGPSGFLYGVNAPGGTINYILKRPTAERFASGKIELSDHDGYYASADLGGPIGDGRVGYRLNVAGQKLGDFNNNGDFTRKFVSGAIDWQLTEDALLRFDADYQHKNLAAQPLLGTQSDGSLPPVVDPRTLLGQPWLRYETDTYNIGSRFEYRINPNWRFTAQLGYSSNTRTAAFPDIYTVTANGNITSGDIYLSPDQTFKTLSGNAFVSGDFTTGALKHQLVTGVSMRNYEAHDGGFAVLPITVGNIFNPVYTAQPANIAYPAKNTTENRQPSVFVSDMVQLSANWEAMLGLRHIRYRNDFTRASTGVTQTYEQNVTVPSAGLIYKPTQNISTYVSYSEGFEQGGVAPFGTTNEGEWQKPIKSQQWELGAKAELDQRLSVSAALFQIQKSLEYVNSAKRYVQDGEQRHRGLELNARGQLSDNLYAVSSVAFIDAKQLDTGNAATTGKRAANVPRFQANTFLDYRIPAVRGLSVNGGVYYVGERELDAQNTVSLPAYTRFDVGARYVTGIGKTVTTWRFNIENLTDKRYWAAASYNSVWIGKSRTYTVSAQVDL
ncbi:TonB-dependent siderophore receptor [Andreprevotia chitinilytica]|uniref:TonB-dependent siderophore receptor n=1 Tax=Andreprevotia chitinilytica TaxID=396808 RepID=UPI00068FC162|nr:TonB-dependent siderophore receptor [Andreprevotia chitinilytica]